MTTKYTEIVSTRREWTYTTDQDAIPVGEMLSLHAQVAQQWFKDHPTHNRACEIPRDAYNVTLRHREIVFWYELLSW